MKLKTKTQSSLLKRVITGLVVVVFSGILAVAIMNWFEYQADELAKVTSDPASYTRSEDDGKQHDEGRDEKPIAENVLDAYTVASEKPRALYVDKLSIAARIMPMGVNADDSMQAPLGIYDAGWYTKSSVPSEDGALVINGHASGPTKYGLFGWLNDLVNGDRVRVETGDGTIYHYEVIHKEDVGRRDIDMKKFLSPYGQNAKGLNLITCAGDWEQDERTFTNRIIVYTKLVES